MIQPITANQVASVARLHCANVRSLLSDLGELAAHAYYTGCVRTELAVGFVDVEDGATRGFVLGSPHPDRLRPAVLARNPVGTLAGLVIGAARHPTAVVSLVRSLRGPDQGSYDRAAAELIYLGVADGLRGSGIGKGLVEAFTEEMWRRNVRHFELSVDQDNGAAIAFYERLGFHRVGAYREFGVLHLRYRRDGTAAQSTVAPQ